MFDKARHAPLTTTAWDEAAARQAISEIAADAEAAYDPERNWRAHPLEEGMPDGNAGLYVGAAGVIWALEFLKREGRADHGLDVPAVLPGLLAASREQFKHYTPMFDIEPERPSYLMGDVPVLLMMIRASPGGEAADELHARLADNIDLPVLELMWGAAGATHAARFAFELSGEARWQTLHAALAERLLGELEESDAGPIWTQALYRHTNQFLGPVHGYAGNMLALLNGWTWLTEAQRDVVRRAVPATLAANAHRSDLGANWPPVLGRDGVPMLVQYCHGAPGMVTALADPRVATGETRALLEAGGELTWNAGPLAKGSNLCHGTGGNGFAFLKLYALTSAPVWLERARAFAMTAIDQWRAANAEHGQGRYSLWTGDVGLACYLGECLRGTARFPTLEVF